MKKILTMLFVASAVAFSGCKYDDSDLWNSVNDLDSRLTVLEQKLNTEIATLKSLIGAVETGTYVSDVVSTAEGHTLTLSDGTSLTINHGSNGTPGASAPVVGVRQESDGLYYWTLTIDGVTTLLSDAAAGIDKFCVTGGTGTTPILGIDVNGYWTVKYSETGTAIQILGPDNLPVKAAGTDGNNGADGDSFFEDVEVKDDEIVLTLADGTEIAIPRSNALLTFDLPLQRTNKLFCAGMTAAVSLTTRDIVQVNVVSQPEGWTATTTFNSTLQQVSITASASASVGDEGWLVVIGVDKKGNVLTASLKVAVVPDYSDLNGTFVLYENPYPSGDNGTLDYYDRNGAIYQKIYQTSNGSRAMGNYPQDIFITTDNRTVLVTQTGNAYGGDGQILVCDSRTLEVQQIYNDLDFQRYAGQKGAPQHIAVVGDKVFIQYVDQSYETHSGIRVFDLSTGTLKADDITGTYGVFGETGALKGRMWVSKGYVVAALTNAVVFINPATEAIDHRIDFPDRQVKGLVKANDGNFYAALSKELTGSDPDGKIVGFDHTATQIYTYSLTGIPFETDTWFPSNYMCASFTQPHLYFTSAITYGYCYYEVNRFDFSTSTFEEEYLFVNRAVYGYMGVHPTNETLFVPTMSGNRLNRYDITTDPDDPEMIGSGDRLSGQFPAGIDFAYRFSTTFTNL